MYSNLRLHSSSLIFTVISLKVCGDLCALCLCQDLPAIENLKEYMECTLCVVLSHTKKRGLASEKKRSNILSELRWASVSLPNAVISKGLLRGTT